MHQEAEMIKTNVDLSKPIFVSRTSLVYFHRTEMAFASDQLFFLLLYMHCNLSFWLCRFWTRRPHIISFPYCGLEVSSSLEALFSRRKSLICTKDD